MSEKFATPSHRESDDEYRAVVAVLSDRWRVIACHDGIQWILQLCDGERDGRKRWTGRSHCLTKKALIRVCRASTAEIGPTAQSVLDDLPDWIGGRP